MGLYLKFEGMSRDLGRRYSPLYVPFISAVITLAFSVSAMYIISLSTNIPEAPANSIFSPDLFIESKEAIS